MLKTFLLHFWHTSQCVFESGLKWPEKKYSRDGLGGNPQLQHFNNLQYFVMTLLLESWDKGVRGNYKWKFLY